MAHFTDGLQLPFTAGSAISAYRPVFMNTASSVNETVVPASQISDDILGITTATVATAGDPVNVQVSGEAKAIAVASLGAGCRVGIVAASAPGLGPITASNIASAANGSGLRYVLGKSVKAAAAGDIFPVLLQPEQIV